MTHRARIKSVRSYGPQLLYVTLDSAAPSAAAQYTRPGQFVRFTARGSKPGFFSLASAPGEPEFGFLFGIEPGKPKTAPLAQLAVGDEVEFSDVLGSGFPLEKQIGRDLLLVGTGTGIAPLRAVLLAVTRQRSAFGRIVAVFGATDQNSIAFHDEFAAWRAKGVELHVVLSRPQPGWQGERGYVQAVLHKLNLNLRRTSALVVGRPTVTDKVTECLLRLGVASEQIYRNE